MSTKSGGSPRRPILSRQSSTQSDASDYSYGSYEYEEDGYDVDSDNGDDLGAIKECSSEGDSFDMSSPHIVTSEMIYDRFVSEAEDIQSICSLSLMAAMTLLHDMKHAKNVLVTSYLEDPEKILKNHRLCTQDCCLVYGETGSENNECFVCGDDAVKAGDFIHLGCGHAYCRDCWTMYLRGKIEEKEVFALRCMQCNISISPSVLESIIQDVPLFTKFKQFVASMLIADRVEYSWCPMPECCQISFVPPNYASNDTDCQACGYKFCTLCNEECHAPAACNTLKLWEKKSNDDGMTSKWLMSNTKDCPKCLTPIEKNGGCNHMTCRKCRYEFCWLCSGDWKNHSACNSHQAAANVSEERAVLEKYLFYWNRFNSHLQSQKLEGKLTKSIQEKMSKMEMAAPSLSSEVVEIRDVAYMQKACNVLISCRRTLKWTYVHAYYIEDPGEKQLFEFVQAQLEANTENLSKLLEANPDYDIRDEIMNQSAAAAKRLDQLLIGADEGMSTVDHSFLNGGASDNTVFSGVKA